MDFHISSHFMNINIIGKGFKVYLVFSLSQNNLMLRMESNNRNKFDSVSGSQYTIKIKLIKNIES